MPRLSPYSEGDPPAALPRAVADSGAGEGASLGDFMRILSAHPLAVLLPLVLAISLGLAYLVGARPTYNATTSILIDARVKSPVGAEGGPALGFPDAALVESQVKLIASDVVLRRVVMSEKLFEDPEFITAAPGLRGKLLSLIGLGSTAERGDPIPSALYTLARAVTVKRSERTYVMDVEVGAGDGEKAARIANAIARAYIADQQDARSEAAKRDIDFLRVRLEDLQARVQDADRKVEAYKTQNRISDANGKLINEQQLLEVTTALGAAHARASEAKAKYDQMQKLAASGKLPDATAEAARSVTLDKLRSQYAEIARQEANYRATLGARHPAMIEVQTQLTQTRKLITDELKRIADTAANEYQSAHAAEIGLERQSDALKKSSGATNQTLVQLRELQREADAQRSVYEKFLRTRETLAGDPSEQPIARVIAPALPSSMPSAPRRAAILALAFIGGLALGIANALLAHAWRGRRQPAGGIARRAAAALRLNRTASPLPEAAAAAKSVAAPETAAPAPPPAEPRAARPEAPESAEPERYGRSADLPRKIASLPWLTPAARRGSNWFNRHGGAPSGAAALTAVRDMPESLYTDVIYEILGRLRAHGRGAEPETVFVTARRSGAGVSTLAANLAFAAAAEGGRVLLIEANGAHPMLSALIGPGAQATPIMLKGMTRNAYNVDAGPEGQLMVVPLESAADHTSEGPGGRLDGIRNNFTFVVIDGAVIGDEDAAMMASAASSVVVVADGAADGSLTTAAVCGELDIAERKLAGVVVPARMAQGADRAGAAA